MLDGDNVNDTRLKSMLFSKRMRIPTKFQISIKKISWKTSVNYLGWSSASACPRGNKFLKALEATSNLTGNQRVFEIKKLRAVTTKYGFSI